MSDRKAFLLSAAEIREIPEFEFHHPLNSKSELHVRSLSEVIGLKRTGFHLGRLPPGREANEYHTHRYQEEYFYILSGRGIATIDGKEYEVGPGDFMAFPVPSVAHGLRSSSDSELVYLVGGERKEFEIAEFPNHKKMIICDRGEVHLLPNDAIETFQRSEVKPKAD